MNEKIKDENMPIIEEEKYVRCSLPSAIILIRTTFKHRIFFLAYNNIPNYLFVMKNVYLTIRISSIC